ncbi:hypothetical protein ARAM_000336 [Aspergillus rambellii]|uniref:60S ribosomal protein L36 n=1 Tax=Aspergillus rambellii TaxID=308745 RepID=A0A0F8UMI0_9EURO|nr:hypothetical protein ARAM_000336 [Aspergillus rambellii]
MRQNRGYASGALNGMTNSPKPYPRYARKRQPTKAGRPPARIYPHRLTPFSTSTTPSQQPSSSPTACPSSQPSRWPKNAPESWLVSTRATLRSTQLTAPFILENHPPPHPQTRISRTKGQSSRRTAFVREIAREVVGLAPYERRIVELLRNTQDKRLASSPRRGYLGTFSRGKKKVEDMQRVIAEARRVAAH